MSISDHEQGFAVLDNERGNASVSAILESISQLSAVGVPDLTTVISPDINALATLLALLRRAVKELQDATTYVEDELVKVMPSKFHSVPGLGQIEMHTGAVRKAWDKENLVIAEKHVIAGGLSDMVDAETGEVVNNVELVGSVLAAFLVAATPSWKVTGLRAHGIDPGDYCQTSWGRKTIATPPLPTATLAAADEEG